MKLGRLAPHPESTHPRLKLGPALDLSQIAVPDSIDYLSSVSDWPMYLNDQLGDCTCAAAGHMIEATTQYGQGATVEVTDADILTAYSAVSGYDPATGDNDNGAVMQDVLDYWRRRGVGGHRIVAFAQLDVQNLDEVKAALWLFGHIYVGINCPVSAQRQAAKGQPWDVVPDDGGIAGGHAIDVGAWPLECVTWGKRQKMTEAFWRAYAEEAWVAIDEAWINTVGKSPSGLDTSVLNADYTQITGKRGPFPANPTPTPAPAAGLVEALRRLVDELKKIIKSLGG